MVYFLRIFASIDWIYPTSISYTQGYWTWFEKEGYCSRSDNVSDLFLFIAFLSKFD